MATASTQDGSAFRVALVWNGQLQQECLLDEPRPVVLGSGPRALFALPEGASGADELTVLRPAGSGYELVSQPGIGGQVWIGAERSDIRALSGNLSIGRGDYGVITVGTIALFFQQVVAEQRRPPGATFRDGALTAALGLSLFLHVASLLFLFLVAAREFAPASDLELDSELVRKFLIIPPPEELKQLNKRTGGTDMDDPGLRDREEAGGKAHERDEGRVGRKNADRADTQLEGPPDEIAQKVRGMGLLGVLSGGGSTNAIANALDAPSLDQVLGGLGSAQTVLGIGSGGTGLRGGGSGGGGTGKGVMFGSGKLGTGVAAGGKGRGKGKGGVGAKGRKAREVGLKLQSSAARVNGFLSKEQINRVVRANQASIKYCFELELQRHPNLQGAVHILWRIDLAGKVTSTRVAKSTMGNAKVEGCMARQIKKWKFPKPDGGEVVVTYPFLFRGN